MLLHQKGFKVNVKYYEILKHRLCDDFDQVRLLATKMIWLLAITYPEQLVIYDFIKSFNFIFHFQAWLMLVQT
jgi:hypothetical protein